MQKKPTKTISPSKISEVPSGRFSRLGKLGGLAARIAGSTIVNTAEQLAKAKKPTLNNTVLTQGNALTITEKLAQMRGAAMKVGQLMSMDAGEFLPAEWEPILAKLRQGADAMPKEQLLFMLNKHWGSDWMSHFSYFSFEPIASASIGQVHKATLTTGETLAIKVQYPGVADSIDSDIDNLGRFLKLSGVAPKELQLDKLLAEAKSQLKREADYRQEVAFMQTYSDYLKEDPRFVLPIPHLPLCNQYILAMSYVDGISLEKLVNNNQPVIDFVCHALMELTLNELFVTGLMQSDPNFANFFYQPETKKIVLLDFGACAEISPSIVSAYFDMALALQKQSRKDIYSAFLKLGLLRKSMPDSIKDMVVDATMTASECLQTKSYNFKEAELVSRLYEQTQGLMRNKDAVASPEFDSALVNRKISGMILLANRLGANLPMQETLQRYLKHP